MPTWSTPTTSCSIRAIVDAFGHVSARHGERNDRFLLSRNLAPGVVSAADILEYEVATGEPVAADPPRLYLERHIHSEIYKARPDVMAVVHNHSPAVLPFGFVKGAKPQAGVPHVRLPRRRAQGRRCSRSATALVRRATC